MYEVAFWPPGIETGQYLNGGAVLIRTLGMQITTLAELDIRWKRGRCEIRDSVF
jgi:hypothetical protein